MVSRITLETLVSANQSPVSRIELSELVFSSFEILALLFGVIWTIVNFYNFYPLSKSVVETVFKKRIYGVEEGKETEKAYLDGGDLPTIDILLPAYKEPEVIGQSIQSIREANYPQRLVTLYVLLEPNDEETQSAVRSLSNQFEYTELLVPDDYPGQPNKPRALNYGFEHSTGDIVGIVDAEDIVESGTFREAVNVLLDCDFALGRLDMVNENDGWLNSQFRAEYGGWYNYMIPSFAQTRFPVPLAGTTCFFLADTLEEIARERRKQYGDSWSIPDWQWAREKGISGLKPWDPENVTEDFELGHFLWKENYQIEILDATTKEESPLTLDDWISQRTRWKKGKMYTFLHYLRNPPGGLKEKFHLFWQSFIPHLGPINIVGIIFVLWIANMAGYTPTPIIEWPLVLGMTFAVMNLVLYTGGYFSTSDQSIPVRLRRSVVLFVTMPFYWLLQWGAEIRAMVQLYSGEFHWEKSSHLGRNSSTIDRVSNSVSRQKAVQYLSNPARIGLLSLIVSVGFALRFYVLDNWSLWIDEIYTITFRASMPVRELLVIPYDPHPPLYFLLLHYWMDIFGQTAFVARSFSLLFSLLGIIAMFYLGYELYDDKTGLFAALLFATSTLQIHFGRTVRMYSLFIFLSLVSWYFFARLHERSRGLSAVYLVSTVALLYTHIYAVFVVAGQYVYMVLSEENNGLTYRFWAKLQAVVLTAYSPWMYILGKQVFEMVLGTKGGVAIEWIPAPSLALLRDTALIYGNFPSFYPVLAGNDLTWVLSLFTLFLFLIAAFTSVVTYRYEDGVEYVMENKQQVGMMLSLFALIIGLPYVISKVFVEMYYPRYTVVASVPLYVLVARGVRNIQTKKMKAAFLGVLLISSGIMAASYSAGQSEENWRGVAETLEDRKQPDDTVVLQPSWIDADIKFYYEGSKLNPYGYPFLDYATEEEVSELKEVADKRDRIWIVRYLEGERPKSRQSLRILGREHEQVLSKNYGIVNVYLYTRENTTKQMSASPFSKDTQCRTSCS